MSLIVTRGFGIDANAIYAEPFIVTLEEIVSLCGTLEDTTALTGTLSDTDSIMGLLDDSTALASTLDDDTIAGTLGCN
jgi:hypothetical protein